VTGADGKQRCPVFLTGRDAQALRRVSRRITLNARGSTHPQLLYSNAWFQDYPDPQNWLSVFWTCDSTFAQPIGYCNEEFDRLTELGDTTVDPLKQLEYYEQAQRNLIDDVPGAFLFNPAGQALVKPNVIGITPAATESIWPGSLSSLMTIDKTAG
jgi:oligopeptide transport system substrate-binding protein